MKLTFPFPPTSNHLYRNVPGKGRVRTERYKTWARAAGNEILSQHRQPVSGPVALIITLAKPDKRKRDLSNGIKAIEDLLVDMRLIDDDRNVQHLTISWGDETTIEIEAA